MSDTVLIVFRKDDVARLVDDHQYLSDSEGIVVLRCANDQVNDERSRYRPMGFETPGPLPRTYDIRSPEFTLDMTETIQRYFDAFQTDGQVLVESNARGLWFVTALGRRPFIGLARLNEGLSGGRSPASKTQVERNEELPCVPLRSS
jgi:hypothetical protein